MAKQSLEPSPNMQTLWFYSYKIVTIYCFKLGLHLPKTLVTKINLCNNLFKLDFKSSLSASYYKSYKNCITLPVMDI